MSHPLSGYPLFDHLSNQQLERLSAYLETAPLAPGETLMRYADPSTDVYLVAEGVLRIERSTPYGIYALAELGAGDILGEASFLDGEPRTGSAVADTDVTVHRLTRAALERLLENDPDLEVPLYWAFWRSLSAKLRATNSRLTQFFSHGEGHSESGEPPPPGQAPGPAGELSDRRQLFEEQKLSNMEIHFLASLSREERYGSDDVIFREGDEGDALYVVLDGKVRISKHLPGAGEEALAFLERGTYFGEMALIDRLPRSADARAHTEGAVVLAIPRDVLESLLDIHKLSSPRLLKILCGLIAGRLRELDEKIVGWFILSGGQG
jgi:CRP/FNR family transcriptional regulator, cyclic AMP receptor protein